MRLFILALLQIFLLLPLTSNASDAPGAGSEAWQKAAVMESYAGLPLYFIKNNGQTDAAVKFYEKGGGHATFFTGKGVTISLVKDKLAKTVKFSFLGANKEIKVSAEEVLETRVNYFKGKDNKQWRRDVPVYGSVMYSGVYDNVDIRFYGTNSNIEHDIIVKAGGDPKDVRFGYEGVKSINVSESGELEVALSDGMIVEQKPFIYQEIDGKRVEVEGSYRIINKGLDGAASYGFNVASYDHARELVIDPVIDYSTYLGGSSSDFARDVAVDASGAAYLTGWTLSPDFPMRTPVQGVYGGGVLSGDVFVTKINPAGTAVVFSTYIGGNSDEDSNAIAVDTSGNVYVTGYTQSLNYPVFKAFQPGFAGGTKDAFVTKLNPTGNAFIFSTYIGGIASEKAKDITVDATGYVYLTGWTASFNFPLVNPIQPVMRGVQDVFVLKMRPPGRGLDYSTLLGGSDSDSGRSITIDATGAAYVTGHTWSFNFPLMYPVQGTFGGVKDVVVFKINPAGTGLEFSTYLGGTGAEKSKGIALDSNKSVYVVGWTSSPDFPVVNPIQGALLGTQDAFLVKLAPPGRRILFSTYLGGSDSDSGRDLAIDSSDSAYVVGHTRSDDFPIVNPLQGMFGGVRDAFVTKVNPSGSSITFSTFLGGDGDDTARGIAFDNSGAFYVAGGSDSYNYPIVKPIQGTNAGLNDLFVTKMRSGGGAALILGITPDAVVVTQGGTLGYTASILNTTAIMQCFDYWENITLPGGRGYPTNGELFGPLTACVNANSTKTVHLTQSVPVGAPLGTYVLNSFVGGSYPVVIDTVGFNFDVTPLSPLTKRPYKSWRLLENGFVQ
ncbi:MAG: SBBP repeat-containing protein [Thermodesulfobacteriota bacterium]